MDSTLVSVIAEALVREYLTKLNLFTVLKIFDESREKSLEGADIRTRKALYESLYLTDEMKENHHSSLKFKSVLEVLVKSHLSMSLHFFFFFLNGYVMF
jgi:hypothetical protein